MNSFFISTSTSKEIFSVIENPSIFYVNTDDLLLNDWNKIAYFFGNKFSEEQLNDLLKAAGYNLALMEKIFSLMHGNTNMFLYINFLILHDYII